MPRHRRPRIAGALALALLLMMSAGRAWPGNKPPANAANDTRKSGGGAPGAGAPAGDMAGGAAAD
ncbi:MAG: hypothetical protein HY076_03925, partial [Candidatus Eisenbacteria bacterium]|nr:hypothetical protein [Candidatus Eisenbacteria bacterium]